MKLFNFKNKIIAFSLALLFLFVSLSSINKHTYTVGLNNFHKESFGCIITSDMFLHSNYNCGKPFHLPYF